MSFIVTPNPDFAGHNMWQVAEFETQELAKTAIDEALAKTPSRVFYLSEKIGAFTAEVKVKDFTPQEAILSPAEPQTLLVPKP